MKRILYIFLSLLLVVPHGIHASQGKQEPQKSEEKKSSWGWKYATAGAMTAALLAYLGYQYQSGEEVQDIKERKSDLELKKKLALELKSIVSEDDNLTTAAYHDVREQALEEIEKVIKKFPHVVAKRREVSSYLNPLNIDYYAKIENPDFLNKYLDQVNVSLAHVIGTSGTDQSRKKMRDALKNIEKESSGYISQTQRHGASGLRLPQRSLQQNITLARHLDNIYQEDHGALMLLIKKNKDKFKSIANWIWNRYPDIYSNYLENHNYTFDPIDIEYFNLVKNQQFKKEYFAQIVEKYVDLIDTYGTNDSKKRVSEVLASMTRE